AVQLSDLVTVVLLTAIRIPQLRAHAFAVVPGSLDNNNHNGLGSWWEAAVSTREIHQATGIAAAQLGVDIATAYAQLVARALTTGSPIAALAAEVVAHRIRFSPNDTVGPDQRAP
ncbi:ANTAR domain-containing protein, partial [Nocardia sp. XZ_19_385]|uniref:ANTAR domain-containing protein n=1 Tax=Nocardia sp. XZ_19_385 TaxID=2769488 RepID=UPI0018909175